MDSKLALIMAEFVMNAIKTKLKMPKLYIRFVDDILAIFKSHDEAEHFFKDLNSKDNDIKFTKEESDHNSLNFLDMTVSLLNGRLETNWHLKTTNTGLYTPKLSYCPDNYKKNVISAIHERSKKLTTLPEEHIKNVKIIKNMFVKNGYHPKFIERCIQKGNDKQAPKDDRKKVYAAFPFIKESHKVLLTGMRKINHILKKNSKIVQFFKTLKTQHIFKNKDKISPNVCSSLVL